MQRIAANVEARKPIDLNEYELTIIDMALKARIALRTARIPFRSLPGVTFID